MDVVRAGGLEIAYERVGAGAPIPGCGHVSNLERPDEFTKIVREFCRAQARTT